MFYTATEGYTGKQFPNGFIGYFVEENLFLLLSIEDGLTQEAGQKLFDTLKNHLKETAITSLESFESEISNFILKNNFPAHFNLAAGCLYQNILYAKTVGKGQIFFRRGKDFDLLMAGDKSASGYVQDYDCAVFTTTSIQNVIGDVNDIKTFVDMNAPKDILEKLQIEEYDEEERGFVVIFAEFTSQAASSAVPVSNVSVPEGIVSSRPIMPTSGAQDPFAVEPPPRKFLRLNIAGSRKVAMILAIILFGILVWSVIFGYQRRAAAQLQKKVETTTTAIDAKLHKAEKDSFLDIEGSLELVAQAKEELASLKKEVGDTHKTDITEIATRIQKAESTILKKEEKPADEFYDLSLENKSAKANALNSEEGVVAMLDTANKTIYILTLEKKSLDKYTASEVAGATHVALYDGKVFFFNPKKGIYQFTSETKARNVVDADKSWGDITDFEIYNGNLYLLDTGKKDIYKYLVAEDGYSNKSSYFNGDTSVDLSDASAITIDSSIYITLGDSAAKFTRGVDDEFKTEYPDKTRHIDGIYTNSDTEQVYLWDKQKGIIYILEKGGKYIRQMETSTLAKASGVFVEGKSIYILAGSKLYTIGLD